MSGIMGSNRGRRSPRKARNSKKSSSGVESSASVAEEESTSQHDDDQSSDISGASGGSDSKSKSQPVLPDIDPDVLEAIRICIRDEYDKLQVSYEAMRKEVAQLNKKLSEFDGTKLQQQLTTYKAAVTAVESSLQYASERQDHMEQTVIPAVTRHMSKIAERQLHESLKMDAHSRKWNVVLHGIDGKAGEEESTTRQAVKDFAKSALKLSEDDVRDSHFSACHRLSKKDNAGIIIRFVDLSCRDKWLSGARNIQTYLGELQPPQPDKKISLAIDLPPKIRPIKDNLMIKRKNLPLDKRRKSKLRYLAQWPFVELKVEGQDTIRPEETLADIAASVLGMQLNTQPPNFAKAKT